VVYVEEKQPKKTFFGRIKKGYHRVQEWRDQREEKRAEQAEINTERYKKRAAAERARLGFERARSQRQRIRSQRFGELFGGGGFGGPSRPGTNPLMSGMGGSGRRPRRPGSSSKRQKYTVVGGKAYPIAQKGRAISRRARPRTKGVLDRLEEIM
jgi:hypothetical protein